ncbi:6743_t:CDS:2 [Funneliformis mosseae]|uniref:6743_t:CDS:1 n=1 Tax=Funneliformis mosseae TaxID=27381 RepID=A0A9N8WP07_FUNMO|nr:6743_t:CDS:2 [Funneliformis mosseae]
MSFTFICLVLEDVLAESFSVRIGKIKYVGDLKNTIKKSKFPVDNEEELQNLTLQDNEALAGAREIRHYWDSTPPKKNIHIIIKPPATGKYYQPPIIQTSPYLSQDSIKIDEIYKKITQPAIETISISKVSSENFRLFKSHLNFKLETVFFDNLPTPSNVSIPAFKWIEKQSEPVYKEEYMNWLRENIPLTGHRVWHDVENNKQLLNYKNPRLPFIIHGGTDVVVVNDFDIKERRHLMQVILEMFVADSLTSDDRKVFGILSNLIDDWHILWYEDMKIKNWVAPSRAIAVEVISRLLRDRSGVDNKIDSSLVLKLEVNPITFNELTRPTTRDIYIFHTMR